MGLILWDKRLETGIPLLDNQHKELLKAANRFFIQCKMKKDKQAAREYLNFLISYVQYHFQAEESFHIKCNYPNRRKHQALHRILAFELKKHALQLGKSNYSSEAVSAFYRFVDEWVRDHIFYMDTDFARYYHENVHES